MTQAQARIQFADWMNRTYPDLWNAAIRAAENESGNAAQLSGLGLTVPEAPTQSFWEKVGGALTGLGTTYLTLKNQRDAMEINLARAQQGLPPIDAASSAPVIRTQVDIDPALATKLASNLGSAVTRNMMIIGAVALIALFMMKKK